MVVFGRKDRTKFRDQVLNHLLEEGCRNDRPGQTPHHKQRYRLTEKGLKLLEAIRGVE